MITDKDKETAEAVKRAAHEFNKAVWAAANEGLEVTWSTVPTHTFVGQVNWLCANISKVIK